MTTKPEYVYVASSWRNEVQPLVIDMLRHEGIECYDFKNPDGGTGFSWSEVKDTPRSAVIAEKGSDWEDVDEYLRMIAHPRALAGFDADFAAMEKADTFVLVLPCGKSAHLEAGWAIGAGKRTIILLEDPVEPELMYRMALAEGSIVRTVEELRETLLNVKTVLSWPHNVQVPVEMVCTCDPRHIEIGGYDADCIAHGRR